MSRLVWGLTEDRIYQSGVSKGVLYPSTGPGLVWNGLVTITETSEGTEETVAYYDGQKYVQHKGVEQFVASIEAYTYPDQVEDGEFSLSYQVITGDRYELHLVYNAVAYTSEASYVTDDETADPSLFKWDISTTPEEMPNLRPCAHIVIDFNETTEIIRTQLEEIMYGTSISEPRMPHLPELISIFEAGAIFRVVDHGDGTWTAYGPDEFIEMLDSTTFKITSPSAIYIDADSYNLSSW
jgi:hypothetical protein